MDGRLVVLNPQSGDYYSLSEKGTKFVLGLQEAELEDINSGLKNMDIVLNTPILSDNFKQFLNEAIAQNIIWVDVKGQLNQLEGVNLSLNDISKWGNVITDTQVGGPPVVGTSSPPPV